MTTEIAASEPATIETTTAGELTAAFLGAVVEVPFGPNRVRGEIKSIEHDASWGRLRVRLHLRSEAGNVYPSLGLSERVEIIDLSEAVGRLG